MFISRESALERRAGASSRTLDGFYKTGISDSRQPRFCWPPWPVATLRSAERYFVVKIISRSYLSRFLPRTIVSWTISRERVPRPESARERSSRCSSSRNTQEICDGADPRPPELRHLCLSLSSSREQSLSRKTPLCSIIVVALSPRKDCTCFFLSENSRT